MSETNLKKLEDGNNLTTRSNKSYPEITAEMRKESISKHVAFQWSLLNRAANSRCDFSDTEDVQERTSEYFKLCTQAGVTPTFLQLSTYFGKSEQACYEWMRKHPNHNTTVFLKSVASAVASIIANCSMDRSLDNATSIFLLKNSHCGLCDNPNEDTITETERTNAERAARAAQYKALVEMQND